MAAWLCAAHAQTPPLPGPGNHPPQQTRTVAAAGGGGTDTDTVARAGDEMTALMASMPRFAFAILASGYIPAVEGHDQHPMMSTPIKTPSLHIYGRRGQDRQVSFEDSAELMKLFVPATRNALIHDSGHIIPTSTSCISAIRTFIQAF